MQLHEGLRRVLLQQKTALQHFSRATAHVWTLRSNAVWVKRVDRAFRHHQLVQRFIFDGVHGHADDCKASRLHQERSRRSLQQGAWQNQPPVARKVFDRADVGVRLDEAVRVHNCQSIHQEEAVKLETRTDSGGVDWRRRITTESFRLLRSDAGQLQAHV